MTNLLQLIGFSACLVTNWHDAGQITLEGKTQNVKVGIIEKQYQAITEFNGVSEKITFKTMREGEPLVKLEPNVGILTNSGPLRQFIWKYATNRQDYTP